MPKNTSNFALPFSFEELAYERAVAIAADTGKIPGGTGPLLETVVDMLEECGRPDEHFDCIQVAGTNGKTSTTRFAAAILRGEGLRTALYTSPQLVAYEERMEIDGRVVDPADFAHGVSAAAEAGRRVSCRRGDAGLPPYTITPFDLLTVAAMIIFAEARVDVAVLEVGLGGRWDATSATDPVAVAITGIGLDHIHILGNTLGEIAREKAAVIKPGRAVVLGEGTHDPVVEDVMAKRCDACGVEPWIVSRTTTREPRSLREAVSFSCEGPFGSYELSMHKPSYQPQNASCAIALAELYLGRALNTDKLERSLDACPIPGRFDMVRTDPMVLVDACHNPQSCENFVAALGEVAPTVAERPTLLVAALSDKDVSGIIDVLIPAFPRIAVTATVSDRACPAHELAKLVEEKLAELGRPASDLVAVHATVSEALDAFTEQREPVVAAGTITLAGEVAGSLRG
ncbi:MAG: Mur ligase family protein [Coriobacteriaceae bacterium]|nr:Mur ligase family protein [Coriobacteriaceae bacterium]